MATFIFWVVVDGDQVGPFEDKADANQAAREIQRVCHDASIQVVREPDYRLGLNRGDER